MEKDDLDEIRQTFLNFSTPSSPGLNHDQLCDLCKSFSMNAVVINRIISLAFPENEKYDVIDFERFCDCFRKIFQEVGTELVNSNEDVTDEVFDVDGDDQIDAVQPKYVKDGRIYGRKSVPQANFDENIEVKSLHNLENINEVKTSQSSTDDKSFLLETGGSDAASVDHVTSSVEFDNSSSVPEVQDDLLHAVKQNNKFQINIFSEFDEDNDGLVDIKRIVEFWRSIDISDPSIIMQVLEVKVDIQDRVDITKLSDAFERFVLSPKSYSKSNLHFETIMYAFVASFRRHLIHINCLTDEYRRENEEMRDNLNQSEIRNSKLAEEADDHYFTIDEQNHLLVKKIESKWQKKLDACQLKFQKEQEEFARQAAEENANLQNEIDTLKEDVEFCRRENESLKVENESLNSESHQIYDKLQETQKENDRLKNDLECLLSVQIKNGGDSGNISQEEIFAKIIKDYESQFRELADRNDELVIETESLRALLKNQNKSEKGENIGSVGDVVGKIRSPTICKSASFDSMLSKGQTAGVRQRSNRIVELENAVELLKQEKKEDKQIFEKEKANLIENYEEKLLNFQSNQKSSEKINMNEKLLEEVTKERDELNERSQMQQNEMTNLCREFSTEKQELVDQFQVKVDDLEKEVFDLKKLLDEKSCDIEKTQNMLKEERCLHDEEFKKIEEKMEDAKKNAIEEKTFEFTEKNLQDLNDLKMKHEEEVEEIKKSFEEKLEALKQKQNIDEDLKLKKKNRIQKMEEEMDSEKRIREEMRESFEKEVLDLRERFYADKNLLKAEISRMMKEQHDEEDKKNKFISERHQLKNNNEILSDKNKLLNKMIIELKSQLSDAIDDKSEFEQQQIKKISNLEEKNQMLSKKVHEKCKEVRKLKQKMISDKRSINLSKDEDSVDDSNSKSNNGDNLLDKYRSRYLQASKQLSDQMQYTKTMYSKLAKTETIVNELFCENSHLMKALQLTEARQKQAEKKWKDEVEKTEILAKLLHHISPKVV